MVGSGCLLLALLAYHIGPAGIWRRLAIVGWGFVPLVLLDGMTEVLHTQGWRHCLSGSHRSLSYGRIFSIRLAGSSINHLTPTAGLGGEVAKGFLLASDREGAQAASAVIIDKLSQALAQLLFVTVGSLAVIGRAALPGGLWIALVSGTSLLLGGVIGFLVVQKYGKLGAFVRWAAAHRLGGARIGRAAVHMTHVDDALQSFYRTRPLDLPLSVVWHVLARTGRSVPVYYFLTLLSVHPSVAHAVSIACLGTWFNLVTFALPTDIGVQETSRVLVFRSSAFPPPWGLRTASCSVCSSSSGRGRPLSCTRPHRQDEEGTPGPRSTREEEGVNRPPKAEGREAAW
jgi:hypothetical protein